MNKTWDEVNEELFRYSVKYKTILNDKHTYEKYLKDNNWIKCKQPRKDNNKRYTGREFIDYLTRINDTSNKIMLIGCHHMSCIVYKNKQLKIEDIWDCSDGCVGNYWQYNR